MDERYTTPEMKAVWSLPNKFKIWLGVELAVLQAREERGEIPANVFRRIEGQASFNVERILALDEEIHHDFLAFVMAVQEHLDDDLKQYFHGQGLTTFDAQEPEFAIRIRDSLRITSEELAKLIATVKEQALVHKYSLKIQRSHGQHGELDTLGREMLWWYERLKAQRDALTIASIDIGVAKISGSMGTYPDGLSPELEKRSLEILGLEPALVSGQILLRDRHARVISTLAILAGVMENIALNIRLMAQTEIKELEEPFKKSQKGSSRMPHKRNPVLSENLCGLARVVRSNVQVALENIPTWSARDISHSSAERVIFPDTFHAVHFMIRRLQRMVEGLVVHLDHMERNIRLTQGVIFSPDVKEALMAHGIDPENAYRISQALAFQALRQNRPYLDVLGESSEIPSAMKADLPAVFDYKRKVAHTDAIFTRCGL